MKLIINRTDGIGDVLLTLPMMKLIKEKHPHAKVGILVSERCAALIPLIDCVNEYWVLDLKWSLKKKWKFLSKLFSSFAPDAYLYVGGDPWPNFFAWLKRVKIRGGLVSKLPSFLFLNKGIAQSRRRLNHHESDYNMKLLSSLDIAYHPSHRKQYEVKIILDPIEKRAVRKQFQKERGDQRPMIFIHPGMQGSSLNWPSSHYGKLIKSLSGIYPGQYLYVVSYTPSDLPYLKGLRNYLEREARQILEKDFCFYDGSLKGLKNFVHLMAGAELFVGPSTGTTHIANALGLKQIALYSPIKAQSPERWGPFRHDEGVVVFRPDVRCEEVVKCAGQSCSYYKCMPKIEVEKVANFCRRLLEKP